MINKLLLASLLAPVSVTPLLAPNATYSWINEQGTTITESDDGYLFSSGTRNDSARIDKLIYLNGLSFDYKITNAASGQVAGFYFNSDGSHNLDSNKSTFTFAPAFVGDQTRFGIYPTDRTDHWFDSSNVPLNQTGVVGKTGFGLDNTLVLNAGQALNVRFTFNKIGPYYKVTIRELTKDLIWQNNANYVSDSAGNYVYTYMEETNIPTDSNGKVYFHEFAYKNSGNNPSVWIGNISESESTHTTVTYHYNSFTKDGNTYTPIVDTQTVEINSKLTEPAKPTYGSYYFAGWYVDPLFKTKWDFENDKVADKTDLYARWVVNQSDIDPQEQKDTKQTVGVVVQLSTSTFVALCVLGGILLILLIVLVWWLIKRACLAKRGGKLKK